MRHISGILRELAESAGFLPKIKKSDEGKTLAVQNGMPVWTSGATGSATVVNVYRMDPTDEFSALALDKTWNDIKTAIDNNIPIIIKYNYSTGDNIVAFGFISDIGDIQEGDYPYIITIMLMGEGEYEPWVFSTNNINGFPDTTNSG